ncbi:MAG TPA: DUF6035 family protein [Thiobacillus sp.]|nr:DUF6035 family protein [Thiobacillus sp.]
MDESEMSLAVQAPEITEVQNMETGDLIPAHVAIGADYGNAMALRMALKQSIAEGSPLYTCPICGVPVYLVSRKEERRFFFRHQVEDGRCPARTRGDMSEEEINARKYNGAKESQAHIRMKEIIAESLRCDPRFSDVKEETVLKSRDRASWRKPDVQAIYEGRPVAFEIQLSTTFLRVIAERRAFYQREGGLLVWIFKSFDADKARLTQEDIFYSNNRNLFLASEETLKASRAAGGLILDCRWAEPFLDAGKIDTRWAGRLAAFGEMEIDRECQRVFLYDYDRQAEALRGGAVDQSLRLEFEEFWLPRSTFDPYDQDAWGQLQTRFRERGIILPSEPNRRPVLLLNALYSARAGHPVGWRYRKLVEVAHCIADRHKEFLRAFRHALAVYGRAEQIRAEDKEEKWRKKAQAYKPLLANNSPEYKPDRSFDDLVDILFPELGWSETQDPAASSGSP